MARLTGGHNLNAFDRGVSADGFMMFGIGMVWLILKIGFIFFTGMVNEFDSEMMAVFARERTLFVFLREVILWFLRIELALLFEHNK
jgi:hypothetical protein